MVRLSKKSGYMTNNDDDDVGPSSQRRRKTTNDVDTHSVKRNSLFDKVRISLNKMRRKTTDVAKQSDVNGKLSIFSDNASTGKHNLKRKNTQTTDSSGASSSSSFPIDINVIRVSLDSKRNGSSAEKIESDERGSNKSMDDSKKASGSLQGLNCKALSLVHDKNGEADKGSVSEQNSEQKDSEQNNPHISAMNSSNSSLRGTTDQSNDIDQSQTTESKSETEDLRRDPGRKSTLSQTSCKQNTKLSVSTKAPQKLQNKRSDLQAAEETKFVIKRDIPNASFCGQTFSWYNPWLWRLHACCTVILIASLFTIPYTYFFSQVRSLYDFSFVVDVMYTLILLLRSRTSYIVDGFEERNLLKVRQKYQYSLIFFLDILSYTPQIYSLFAFIFLGQEAYFGLESLLKCVRLHFILYYFATKESEPGSNTVIYRTAKYIVLTLMIVYYTSCGWYTLACSSYDEKVGFSSSLCSNGSWITFIPREIEDNLDIFKIYHDEIVYETSFLRNPFVTSLYWGTSTATTTGYGDVHAHTLAEKTYSMVAMLIGMMTVYGLTLGGITSMLTNTDARRSNFSHRYKAFKKEVVRMGVTDNVKDVSLRYYDYLWHRWEGDNIYLTGVLDYMPHPLRAKFAEESFRTRMIDRVDLLRGMDDAFLRNLALAAHPAVFLENQYVQRSGSMDSNMCFIQNGSVEVLDKADEDRILIRMHSGKLFGQINLAFDLPRTNSVRCKTNCDMFVLNKHDFRELLVDYPQAAKKFVEAVQEKCNVKTGKWPLEAPSFENFQACIRYSAAAWRNPSHVDATAAQNATDVTAPTNITMARRMTSVSLDHYSKVDVREVQSHTGDKIFSKYHESPRASVVEYLMVGNLQNLGKKLSITLEDGTEMMGGTKSRIQELEELAAGSKATLKDPEVTTWLERFNKLTLVNPYGKFYKFWTNYIAFLSLGNALYTTFIAAFTTTPGREKTYSGNAAESLNLFDLSYYYSNCNSSLWPLHANACGSLTNFTEVVECIVRVGGPFAERISGSVADGYNISVPAWLDTRSAAINRDTAGGWAHTLLPYVLFDLFFYINIFVRLRTEVPTLHGTRSSFKEIFASYKKWLLLDVAGVFPTEISMFFVPCSPLLGYHVIAFARLNRCLYFFRYVPALFAKWEDELSANMSRVRTAKFVIYIYSITHMCACVFYWVSCAYVMHPADEILHAKCQFGSWGWVYGISYETTRWDDFITTLYWSSTTLTSVGFGDITPTTPTERVVALTSMMIGTIIYGWLVAVLAATVSNSTAAEANYRSSMVSLSRYLTRHNVPASLVDRLMNVRRIEWERYAGTATPGIQGVGRELPKEIQCVMHYESVHTFVEKLPFFRNLSPTFYVKVSSHVQTFHFARGDVIMYQGDSQRNLFIIKQGHCDAVTEDLSQVYRHLLPGDYFGEESLLFGCAAQQTIISDTDSEVLYLRKSDLDSVLSGFPLLEEQMKQVEQNPTYKADVLASIKALNSRARVGIDMSKRYEIVEAEGGIKYYGKKIQKRPLFALLSKEDRKSQTADTMFEKILSCFLLPLTIWPRSGTFMIYEVVRIFLIFVNMFIFPLQFGLFPQETVLMAMQYILDGISIIDQYIRAHVAFYNEEGVAVTHPVQTARHYLRTSFALDLIAWLPIELLVYAFLPAPLSKRQWRLIAVLRLNRLAQMTKVFSHFSYWLSNITKTRRWLKHLSSVFYAALLHNFFASVLYLAACPPELVNNDDVYKNSTDMILFDGAGDDYCPSLSWLGETLRGTSFLHLDRQHSASDQYIISLYWSTVTLVCAGYGDVHSFTVTEMLTSTVMMVIGTLFYSYIAADISANIQTKDTRRGLYKVKIKDIRKFFRVCDVTPETREQVLDYYYYLWDRTHGVTPDHLMVGLPPSSRRCLYQCMYGRLIREAFYDGDKEPDQETQGFFRLMASYIEPHFFLEGNVICRQGDKAEEMYFIERGEIAIMKDDEKTVLRTLKAGEHFGEVELVFGTTRSATVKAVTHCDVSILTKNHMDMIMQKFPQYRAQLRRIDEDRYCLQEQIVEPEQNEKEQPIARKGLMFDSRRSIITVTQVKLNGLQKKVIDRDSNFIWIWKHLTLILSLISSSITIYRVCFFNHSLALHIVDGVLDMWFFFNMLLSFHTNYRNKFSTTINDLTKIHRNYVRTPRKFLLDAVANLPAELIGFGIGANATEAMVAVGYARLNRVLRMHNLLQIFASWENDIRRKALILRMYKAFLLLLFTINTLGCIWYGVAVPNGLARPHSWISVPFTNYKEKQLHGHDWQPFIDSLYWLTAALTTTGYGDIKPENQIEMVYACTIMVIGKMIVGYILGMVAATLANDESVRICFEQSVTSIKRCMIDLNYNRKLYNHVVKYYDFIWMKNNGISVTDLFPDLTFSLRADVYMQICKGVLPNIKLFHGCPDNFYRHLSTMIEPVPFMPGDYICLQGDVRSELYMIDHGVAEVVATRDQGKPESVRLVLEGDSFMTEGVLCKVRNPYSLRAQTYVDVFILTKESLDRVKECYPAASDVIAKNGRRLFPDLHF